MDLYKKFEGKLQELISIYTKRLKRIYNSAIVDVTIAGRTVSYRITDKKFNIDDYPVLKKRIDEILRKMSSDILSLVNNATKEAWMLSNERGLKETTKILGKRTLPEEITDKIFNPNERAYRQFISRVSGGMKLSERIWQSVKPFKHELEAGLTDGINSGRSATKMAADMKRYLKEPDKLFRRVRDAKGKLQLSKAAKAYHPGRGVYRSSYKNALRLTATETNMAYRNADIIRWRNQDFVLGYEIKLSKNHVHYDICDPLAGRYPKEFNWDGWHPFCRCFAVPVIAGQEQIDERIKNILGTSDKEVKFKYITEPPGSFAKYVSENQKRIEGWKSKPYWWLGNSSFR